jgi:hypothetical protein
VTSVRHTTLVVARAVELADVGWTAGQIPGVLDRELGVRPTRETVLRWTNARYAERARVRAFIRRLRSEGVPKSSIAKVCTVLFGEPVSRDQVCAVLERAS